MTTDPVLARISEAVARAHAGEVGEAAAELAALWAEVEGDPLHRMALAHAMADLQDDPREVRLWDGRALLAARALSPDRLRATGMEPSVEALLPSLHLNLGEAHRQLGELGAARAQLLLGLEHVSALPDEGYGAFVRQGLARLSERLDAGPELQLAEGPTPPRDALVTLYEAVGWAAYTRHPERLERAVRGSTWVMSAWRQGRLVGLIRVLSDDATIAYIQDILVHPESQRQGVGRELLQAALDRFRHVRQKVLITADEPRQHAFYASLGLTDTRALPTPIRTFVRFERA